MVWRSFWEDASVAETKTHRLVGQNYTTPDMVAKVTGRAKYAEDYKADGMLWAKLLLSPMPHARVTRLDISRALAMPGVKAGRLKIAASTCSKRATRR